MKKTALLKNIFLLIFSLSSIFEISGCLEKINKNFDENEMYDGPDKAMEFEFNRTKDPATGTVPRYLLVPAMQYTDSLKAILPFQLIAGYGNWTERGPSSDAVGVSNGNTRANSGIASGRIRAILVDASDATGKTVWVGGVDGGLWKTIDITSSSPNWTLVNDFFSNMAITSICQDPTNSNTMYFCTGEAYFNGDAVSGDGVFKSTDHGVNWSQLGSTTTYTSCSKILCDASGNIYLGTVGSGILRSPDGTTWTNITPTGSSSRIADMEISSTGKLHIATGLGNSAIGVYRFTSSPSSVTSATWTSATTPFPYPSGINTRVELGCFGNTLFALPSNNAASPNVTTIYKSTDGGVTWAATGTTPSFTSGQAWYCLAVDINPSDPTQIIVGSLDCYKTSDGGSTWSKISTWVGNSTQYVHADQHIIKWYDNGNKLLIGCDGGIHYSSDGGTTIRDRNTGLRIKQFYSCAIHPITTNYFLAGAQDNGCHQFSSAGLGSTVEVTGGDGAFVAIDQDQSTNQFGSYVYNRYRRSTDGGATWSSVDFNVSGFDFGQFINPWDYDNTNNNIYASAEAGNYLQWLTAPSTSSPSEIAVALFNSNKVSAVKVSPYTNHLVFFGTDNTSGNCRLVKAVSANTASPTFTNITSASMPTAATVSCINTGTTDNNLIACFSNYGVASVWLSSDGGSSWTSLDNNGVNLPDMPVRWCMFVPGTNTGAIIATEAGVYVTTSFSGTTTNWFPSPSFPTVRTDMLQYRSSDGIIAAATHGRGLWTQPYYSVVPTNKFLLRGRWQTNTAVELAWDYDGLAPTTAFDIEMSTDAIHFNKVGTVAYAGAKPYSFIHSPGQKNIFYRIKSNELNNAGRYSNSIRLSNVPGNSNLVIKQVYPNPVKNELNVSFTIAEKGQTVYLVTNIAGQPIWRKDENLSYTGAYNKNWDMTGIKPGVYLLTIQSGGEKRTMKFVKQ